MVGWVPIETSAGHPGGSEAANRKVAVVAMVPLKGYHGYHSCIKVSNLSISIVSLLWAVKVFAILEGTLCKHHG